MNPPTGDRSALTYAFTLQVKLPTDVVIGGERWTLALSYDHKGRHAELVATNGRRSGTLLSGRTRTVESDLGRPISVPVGTIRHAIGLALVARGAARFAPSAGGFW